MRRRFETPTTVLLLFAGVAALAAGCASSSKQKTSEETSKASKEASSESEAASGEAESADRGDDETEGSSESDREPVKLASIIGADTSESLPEGCPGEWQELTGRDYDGTKYACEGFRVPKRYEQPTVMIGVRENTVRRVTLQAFYEKGEPIKNAYASVTDSYEKRCDADSASGTSMSFLCDDYVAQISHRKRTGSLRVVLGLENWDMP